METHDQLIAKLQELEGSKTPLKQIIAQSNQNAPRLAELKKLRIETLAEAMIAGKAAPNIVKRDMEITEIEKSFSHDRERAEIASVAIGMIDTKKSAVVSDLRQMLEDTRQDAIAVLDSEFWECFKQAQALEQKVVAEIDSFPKTVRHLWNAGFSVARNSAPVDIEASVNKARPGQLDSELLGKLESTLRQAGTIARVQSDHLNADENWKMLYSFLMALKKTMINAVRDRNTSVPEWAFSGNLSLNGLMGPLIQRLRAAGVCIATELVDNPAAIGFQAGR